MGLAGLLVAIVAVGIGSVVICYLIRGDIPIWLGEYAAPYGFVAGFLGLILGGWYGSRLGKRLD
jgi:hypothetical protein